MDDEGSRNRAFLSEEAPHTGISLHRGPFTSEGNLESGKGGHILGTLNDECRRALGTGHICLTGLHEGDLESPLLGTMKDMLNKALGWASVSIGAALFLGPLR